MPRLDLREISKAMAEVEDPPCAGCDLYYRCAFMKMACRDFYDYINQKKQFNRRNPNQGLYKMIFVYGRSQ